LVTLKDPPEEKELANVVTSQKQNLNGELASETPEIVLTKEAMSCTKKLLPVHTPGVLSGDEAARFKNAANASTLEVVSKTEGS